MKKNVSYLPLIEHWEKYLSSHTEGNLHRFGEWLSAQTEQYQGNMLQSDLQKYFDKNSQERNYSHLNSEAAYLVYRLTKFIKSYTKPVLERAGLINQDEFSILSHVQFLKECTKKRAIDDNLIDTNTGIDMIRRLINKGFLKERINAEDKREKIISLTRKGEKALGVIYEGFASIQELLVDMNTSQRQSFVSILKHLDDFHTKNIGSSETR